MRKHPAFYKEDSIEAWLGDNKIPTGCTQANVEFLRQLSDIIEEYKKHSCLLFFLLVDQKQDELRTLFNSCDKQKRFLLVLYGKLKERQVTGKYIKGFDRDFAAFRTRISRIDMITKENIRLSDLHPFFQSFSFEEIGESTDYYKAINQLNEQIEAFRSQHQDLIDAHVAKILPEVIAQETRRAMLKAQEKAEKDLAKETARREKAEQKEIQKEAKAEAKRQKQIYKSFERYYKK